MNNCHLDEMILLDYIAGDAPSDVRAAVEASPECIARAQELSNTITPFRQFLYRSTCPDEDLLVEYQEGHLTLEEQLVIGRHVQQCPLCHHELALLTELDAVPMLEKVRGRPSLVEAVTQLTRQAVEAVLRPPLSLGLAGSGLRYYEAPQVVISLSTHKTLGRARTWTLLGQIHDPADGLVEQPVDVVTLRQTVGVINEWQAEVADDGTFMFVELAPGPYELRVTLQGDQPVDVFIRDLNIGTKI